MDELRTGRAAAPLTPTCPAARGRIRISSPQGHSFGRVPRSGATVPAEQNGSLGSAAVSSCSTPAIIGKRTKSGKGSGTRRAAGGRRPTCSRRLIKLAAAGVKVREGREHGVRTHCRPRRRAVRRGRRAGGASSTRAGPATSGPSAAGEIAENPPRDPGPSDAPVTPVFAFQIEIEQHGPIVE